MPNGLQEVRRAAGYRSARAFAEAAGIPAPTYAKYENTPERIPTQAAWKLADLLGVTIDVVVGREPVDAAQALRGEVQREYDSYSPECRKLADEFRAFLRAKDEAERRRRAAERELREEALCRNYERLFDQACEGDEGLAAAAVFGTSAERRAAFESFVAGRIGADREERVCAALDEEEMVDYFAEAGLGAVDETGHFTVPKATRISRREQPELAEAALQLDALTRELTAREEAADAAKVKAVMAAYGRLHPADVADFFGIGQARLGIERDPSRRH